MRFRTLLSHFLSHFLIRIVLTIEFSSFFSSRHFVKEIMAETQSFSANQKRSKKNVPPLVSELIDLAIFSFACQSGLRASHKIRGDPVIEGVAAFFGRLVSCSSQETKVEFYSFSSSRLGNWEPQAAPTEELRTLLSSRLKTAKTKRVIRENLPVAPSTIIEKEQTFWEETDRVRVKIFSKCWRCSRRCAFCIAKRKDFREVWKLPY